MSCCLLIQLLQVGLGTELPGLPPTGALEQMAIRRLGLDGWDYAGARERLRARHWLPTVVVRGAASAWDRASLSDDVALLDSRRTGYSGEVSLTWHLAELVYDDHEIALAREHLQVQRAIAEATARVRADVAEYRLLGEAVNGGRASREALVQLRNALLSGRASDP